MTNEVATTDRATLPVLTSIKGVAYDELVKNMSAELDAGGSDYAMFPGDCYTFKKGHWFKGYGKDAPRADKEMMNNSLVVNAANVIFAYRMFVEKVLEDGKIVNVPEYIEFANPGSGQRLSPRDKMPLPNKEDWPADDEGKRYDPVQKVAVLPFRFESEDKDEGGNQRVHHLQVSNWSGFKAVMGFMRDFGSEGRSHLGKLPVVNVDSKEEQHWEKENISWFVPTFEIVDWEDPIAEDFPDNDQVFTAEQTEADIPTDGGVTSTDRTEAQTDDGVGGAKKIFDDLDQEPATDAPPKLNGAEKKSKSAANGRRKGSTGGGDLGTGGRRRAKAS